jgi:hypothetical protein
VTTTWAARPWDRQRQRQRVEVRAQLARVQRETEEAGQQTLLEEEPGAVTGSRECPLRRVRGGYSALKRARVKRPLHLRVSGPSLNAEGGAEAPSVPTTRKREGP